MFSFKFNLLWKVQNFVKKSSILFAKWLRIVNDISGLKPGMLDFFFSTGRFSLSQTKSCYVKWNYSTFCGLCGTTMPPHHTHEVMSPIDPPGLPQGVPRFHLHYIKLTFLRQEGFCLFLHISCKTSYYVKLKQKKNLPEGDSQNMSQNKAKIFEFWEFCYFSCGMWNIMGKTKLLLKQLFSEVAPSLLAKKSKIDRANDVRRLSLTG